MNLRILIISFYICFSCKNAPETNTEQLQIVVDSTNLKVETVEKQSENSKLISFLQNPIDLQTFKKQKSINYTTTGVNRGMDYHFHPKIKDSVFYLYNYPSKKLNLKRMDRIIVFKYGENKHRYDDETEILIELRIFNNNSNLGKANLIGFTKKELETEFGSDYLILDNLIIYSNKNKVLMLVLKKSKVDSFRYIKLSTEKIDSDLIRQIVK